MRKLMLAAVGAVLASSIVLPASAEKPGGGTMPAASAYGLCKAYFSGSNTGKEHKRKAPPFQDLAAKAEAADQSVEEFCAAQKPGGK